MQRAQDLFVGARANVRRAGEDSVGEGLRQEVNETPALGRAGKACKASGCFCITGEEVCLGERGRGEAGQGKARPGKGMKGCNWRRPVHNAGWMSMRLLLAAQAAHCCSAVWRSAGRP